MSSPVLYRKWRPQALGEVVGQDHVVRTLLNALASGRVAHAYLFTGPRGTGKTSTARILAKAVNCTENGKGEPCGACPMCKGITEGSALDLIEIDAASNRGIDDIRSLREKINFAPNEARYKVYVVDEVHMLTTEAFNALLKTLEEPPPYAIFVLATTEVHRVPVTILSRCQRFDFRRIPQAALVEYLQRICAAEHVIADPAALELIARSANGGGRDAVNLLEQADVAGSGEIRLEAVRRLLGLTGDPRSIDLLKCIVSSSLGEGLTVVQQVAEDGVSLAQFGKEVAGHLRSLLLMKARNREVVDLAPEVSAELTLLVQQVSLDRLVNALRTFSQIDYRGDAASSLPLELALVDAVSFEERRPAPAAAPRSAPAGAGAFTPSTGSPTPRFSASGPAASRPSGTAVRPEPADIPRPAVLGDRNRVKPAPAAHQTSGDGVAAEPPPARPTPGEPVTVEQMRVLLREVQIPQLKFIEAILRNGCSVEAVENESIVIGFKEGMRSHKDRIEKPEALRLAEAAVRELTGTPYRLRFVVVEQPAGAPPSRQSGHLVQAAINAGARHVPQGPESSLP